jgi:hypothetical protein
MERASVESSVSVTQPADVDLLWNDDQTSVSIVPTEHWAPGTYYTISVGAGALASTGRPMTTPARAAFLTRDVAAVAVAPTSKVQQRVAIDSSFTVAFDQSVDLSTVAGAIRLDPPATGALSRTTGEDGVATYTFDPTRPLAPDTRYRLVVDGVRDAAGLEVAPVTMAVRTVAGPEIVRFRPRTGTSEVTRVTPISVRFSQAMDRTTTKKAFTVTADGKRVAGTIRFAEGNTVLVFDPAATLPYDATSSRPSPGPRGTQTASRSVRPSRARSRRSRSRPRAAPPRPGRPVPRPHPSRGEAADRWAPAAGAPSSATTCA